ncbi:serine/threonine/tyrosine-interacting protein isoform X2 [Stegostoma tigrinum]|uniref:serine/threonine/tyrosine-interacting protein isoform X2 n=1 Tax=Stegostoma tigrinum TaxID=3053191 RepID=UPI00286FC9AE|nr:serine/threonine/tyrosine-interacting protein isoform X2 [Stegostoma tigrinum]
MDGVHLEFPALPSSREDAGDWMYPMRRAMQEILPGLYLGPYSAAMKSKLPILEENGITHIICVRQDIEANFIKANFQEKFRYLVLDIADNPVENIIRYFPVVPQKNVKALERMQKRFARIVLGTKEFIDGCLENGGKVLLHGNAGISRSAALVIAYIMETFGVKYRDAFTYVQERRFCINPNAGFVHQLQEYEAIYLAKLTIKMMSPLQLGRSVSAQGTLKRMLEDDDDISSMQVAAVHDG